MTAVFAALSAFASLAHAAGDSRFVFPMNSYGHSARVAMHNGGE
jgi:hypothetical protein